MTAQDTPQKVEVTLTYPCELSALARDSRGNPLICAGCAHAAPAAPFPGVPSGEWPCWFCTRNVLRQLCIKLAIRQLGKESPSMRRLRSLFPDFMEPPPSELAENHPSRGIWYDGSHAVSVPMDCYCSRDMKQQIVQWLKAAAEPGKTTAR